MYVKCLIFVVRVPIIKYFQVKLCTRYEKKKFLKIAKGSSS